MNNGRRPIENKPAIEASRKLRDSLEQAQLHAAEVSRAAPDDYTKREADSISHTLSGVTNAAHNIVDRQQEMAKYVLRGGNIEDFDKHDDVPF